MEEEKQRHRREWMIKQEEMYRHNRLDRKMEDCNRRRRSRNESPSSRHRRTSEHHTPKVTVLSKMSETASGTIPLFRGSVGMKIDPIQLHKIKVNIHRNIPGIVTTNELKRDIPNKEDVVLKRRLGEGSKPIFNREETKRAISNTEEVEERRTVVFENLENSGEGSKPIFDRVESKRAISNTEEVEERRTVVSVNLENSGEGSKLIFDRVESKRAISNTEEVEERRTVTFVNLENSGEESKPIFDRVESKRAISNTEEVEERRTVAFVNLENSENEPGMLGRHSASLSSTRTRRHTPRRTSSSHSRYDNSKYEHKRSYSSDREKDYSRERKAGDRSYRDRRERSKDRSRERRERPRDRSRDRRERSRDRSWDRRERSRDRSRDCRERSRERSRDRRNTDRSRESSREKRELDRPTEQRVLPERYVEPPIPVPIYYGNFQPWAPIRRPFGGNIHPMTRPLRPFLPRSIGIPPVLYDLQPPLNPRFPQRF